MSRIKDRTLSATAATALPWLDRNIPVTQQIAQKLSSEVRADFYQEVVKLLALLRPRRPILVPWQ